MGDVPLGVGASRGVLEPTLTMRMNGQQPPHVGSIYPSYRPLWPRPDQQAVLLRAARLVLEDPLRIRVVLLRFGEVDEDLLEGGLPERVL